jgi:hypothetical protein
MTIASETFPHCKTQVTVHSDLCDDKTLCLCIDTGAAYLQTYATRDELRELGEMLLRHANANEVLEVA